MKTVSGSLGKDTVNKRVIAVRVEMGSGTSAAEMYNLVKPTKRSWKVKTKCTAAGVICQKGTYVLEVQYYKSESSDPTSGNRTYTLTDGPGSTFILPVICLVHSLGDLAFCSVRRNADQVDEYVLSDEDHERIMNAGALTPEG